MSGTVWLGILVLLILLVLLLTLAIRIRLQVHARPGSTPTYLAKRRHASALRTFVPCSNNEPWNLQTRVTSLSSVPRSKDKHVLHVAV
jgi:hypothetical protein